MQGYIISLPVNCSKSSFRRDGIPKHQLEQISTSRALSADLDSIWASVLVWEGGSMVKRITQNSPTRCSHSMPTLFTHPSIHLSSLTSLPPPSISQCVVIFVCSSFSTPVRKTILSLRHVFSIPIPPFLSLTTLLPLAT